MGETGSERYEVAVQEAIMVQEKAKKDYSSWTKEELIEEVKKLKKRKKYGLVWEDKPELVAELCKEKLPILTEDKSKEIITDKNKLMNILIEGDNYHALSVLNYTHQGKIDVIYIDPPYNTGNESFVYNDKIVDINDSYRHSKWLSFMEKRLKLAKILLKDNSIIFISIDENEFAQLKMLCDAIFGEKNLIAVHVWRKIVGGKSQGKISTQHEYIFAYAKNEALSKIANLLLSEKLFKKYKYGDERGKYDLRELGQGKGLTYSESLYYEIEAPDTSIIPKPPEGKGYRWSKEKWMWGLKQRPPFCLIKKVKGRWLPFTKQYLDYDNAGNKIERGVWPHTWLDDHGFTRTGTKNLEDLIGGSKFGYPKPVKLIKYLIALHPNKSCTVLDFFVGSGTTAQAVLELNQEDEGNRRFIVNTNDEKGICKDVCYPRIKEIMHKLGDKENSLVGNLKYFKTDFVDGKLTNRNKKTLVDKSTEMLCLKEDCFEEISHGTDFKIFKNNDGKYLGIVYDDSGIEPIKKEIRKVNKKFVVYVFSLDDSAREDEFEEISSLADLKPIPNAIMNVYKRLFK